MAKIGAIAHWVQVAGVQAVLHLHARESANVDVVSECGVLGEVSLDPHVDVERLVGFLLTVLDAFNLLLVLWCSEIEIHAVFVAFFEQKSWKGILLKRVLFAHGVTSPSAIVSFGCHFLFN